MWGRGWVDRGQFNATNLIPIAIPDSSAYVNNIDSTSGVRNEKPFVTDIHRRSGIRRAKVQMVAENPLQDASECIKASQCTRLTTRPA
jgi:hypothetical protein